MNMAKLKGYFCATICIISLTAVIVFVYNDCNELFRKPFSREEYIIYDPKEVLLSLAIPVGIYFDLLCLCLIIPYSVKTVAYLQKFMVPVTIYGLASFAIGFIISIIISFYPLGTDYYKCHSTSIISSGSRYAKSKEICKQRGSGGY